MTTANPCAVHHPEPVRHYVIAQRLPKHTWPDRVLRVTAIDTATEELVVFDVDSGVDLADAVAAGVSPASPHSSA